MILLLCAAGAAAQTVTIDELVSARDCRHLLVHEGVVYGGLQDGGVLFWPEDDPTDLRRWTTDDGLAGHLVTDLSWSGRALWVATSGTGLTRVELGPGGPSFRPITNLGVDLHVTAVAGVLQGNNERVHFGLAEGGVGIITGGLPGGIATTLNTPGLVSDEIRDLLFVGDDLWIATAAGVSLLSDGIYTDAGTGLDGRNVWTLRLDAAGDLYAGTSGGVFRHDAASGLWTHVPGPTVDVTDLTVLDGELWALTAGNSTSSRVHRWDGSAWQSFDAPHKDVLALAAGEQLWCSGWMYPSAGNLKARQAWYAGFDGAQWTMHYPDALVFSTVDGISIGPDGGVWMGDHAAGGFAHWDGTTLEQFHELAETAPDSIGLFNDDGGMLDVSVAPDGGVWVVQFAAGGVLRYRPDLGTIDHLSRDNTPMISNRIQRVVHHPDGPVLLLNDRDGVDILLDPDEWRNPDAWIKLPTVGGGLAGINVKDAFVESRDRIWFAVKPAGIVLWDPNGAAGADAPLTWTDPDDDRFSEPLTGINGTNFSFDSVNALAIADDGALWAAGSNGVVHARLLSDVSLNAGAVLLHTVREKTDASVTGLVRSDILDLALDANGDVWVCHDAGLDRIRIRDEDLLVDPFVGQAAYLAYGLDAIYGPAALAGLPEGRVRKITAGPDGRTLAAGSDGGAILLRVGPLGLSSGPLDPLFLYPNPLLPAEHAGLRLGGIRAEVVWTSTALVGGASVSVYNTEGQLVWRRVNVANDEVFWTGENLAGTPAGSGTYIVRVEYGGQTSVVPLSLVR